MSLHSVSGRGSARRSVLTIAGAAVIWAFAAGAHADDVVNFGGAKFVNKGLVGVARVPASAKDKFGESSSLGSAIALDLDDWRKDRDGSFSGTLYALPDRGWNTEGSTDFRSRLHRFEFKFKPFYGAAAADQNQLQLSYRDSILFHRPGGAVTTGLDASGVLVSPGPLPDFPQGPNGAISIDAEGVALAQDGSFWISDEYGPYAYHYTKKGALIEAIRPPEAFIPRRKDANGNLVENFSSNNAPVGTTYNPSPGNPLSGRQNNQGLEGLSLSPDGKTLFILLQSALIQDLNSTSSATIRDSRRNTRLLAYDLRRDKPKLVGEYVVQLPLFGANGNLTAAQSELFALNDRQFLVLARDSAAGFTYPTAVSLYRSVDLLDISKATNIANTDYDKANGSVAPNGVLNPAIKPAKYVSGFVNINDNAQLNRFGLRNGAPNDKNNLYEKWEGLALAPVGDPRAPDDYFLFIGNDNDFITQQGNMAGQPYADSSGFDVDSMFLVYRVTLPTYKRDQFDGHDDHDHDHGHDHDNGHDHDHGWNDHWDNDRWDNDRRDNHR